MPANPTLYLCGESSLLCASLRLLRASTGSAQAFAVNLLLPNELIYSVFAVNCQLLTVNSPLYLCVESSLTA